MEGSPLSSQVPWWFFCDFATIIPFLCLEIYTCECDNKLESSEDRKSSTVSDIFRGCWVLWGQVKLIPSCIFLIELGAGGGNWRCYFGLVKLGVPLSSAITLGLSF
jgi:hypothetical protein